MSYMPSPADFDNELLPPGASKLERALEKALRLPPRMWETAGRVGAIKTDLPDEAISFMVWELGLEPVMQYIEDARQVLRDGREWQRIRGTSGSITMALSWTGRTAFVEEMAQTSWWDLYQLGLDAAPGKIEDVETYVALARLSQAAHTDLVRIYAGYDLRALQLNHSRINGDFLLNDWSGVKVKDDWPKLSFGRYENGRTELLPENPKSRSGWSFEMSGNFNCVTGFRLNDDLLNGPEKRSTRNVAGSVFEILIANHGDYSDRYGGWAFDDWPGLPYGKPMPRSNGALSTEISLSVGQPVKRLNPQNEGLRFNRDRINGKQTLAGRSRTGPDVAPDLLINIFGARFVESAIIVDMRESKNDKGNGLHINAGQLNRDHLNERGETKRPKRVFSADTMSAGFHDFSTRAPDWPAGGWPASLWPQLPYGRQFIQALLSVKTEVAWPQQQGGQ